FATLHPESQYVVADIPPTLYISQEYLASVFPESPMFRFRQFSDFDTVADEMTRARFVFLEPQQLELLPDRHVDLALTVSTLHEMRADQVEHYLRIIDRICGGAFYTKQWRRFYNHADDVLHAQRTYPIPREWKRLYEGSPLVPPSFFEALYDT